MGRSGPGPSRHVSLPGLSTWRSWAQHGLWFTGAGSRWSRACWLMSRRRGPWWTPSTSPPFSWVHRAPGSPTAVTTFPLFPSSAPAVALPPVASPSARALRWLGMDARGLYGFEGLRLAQRWCQDGGLKPSMAGARTAATASLQWCVARRSRASRGRQGGVLSVCACVCACGVPWGKKARPCSIPVRIRRGGAHGIRRWRTWNGSGLTVGVDEVGWWCSEEALLWRVSAVQGER